MSFVTLWSHLWNCVICDIVVSLVTLWCHLWHCDVICDTVMSSVTQWGAEAVCVTGSLAPSVSLSHAHYNICMLLTGRWYLHFLHGTPHSMHTAMSAHFWQANSTCSFSMVRHTATPFARWYSPLCIRYLSMFMSSALVYFMRLSHNHPELLVAFSMRNTAQQYSSLQLCCQVSLSSAKWTRYMRSCSSSLQPCTWCTCHLSATWETQHGNILRYNSVMYLVVIMLVFKPVWHL